jgi:hypothetical protein
MVFWAVCLLVPAATYGLMLIELFKYLMPRKELRRRVIIGILVFAGVLGGLWLWNYQVSMVLFTIPFLIAPPVRLVLFIKNKVKEKWNRVDASKAFVLGVMSLCCAGLLFLIVNALILHLPIGPKMGDFTSGKQIG